MQCNGSHPARSPENFCGFFLRICLGILHWEMAGICGECFYFFSSPSWEHGIPIPSQRQNGNGGNSSNPEGAGWTEIPIWEKGKLWKWILLMISFHVENPNLLSKGRELASRNWLSRHGSWEVTFSRVKPTGENAMSIILPINQLQHNWIRIIALNRLMLMRHWEKWNFQLLRDRCCSWFKVFEISKDNW